MCPGADSASKNEYEDTSGGKHGRCVRLTTLPPSQCRKWRKSGALTYRNTLRHLGLSRDTLPSLLPFRALCWLHPNGKSWRGQHGFLKRRYNSARLQCATIHYITISLIERKIVTFWLGSLLPLVCYVSRSALLPQKKGTRCCWCLVTQNKSGRMMPELNVQKTALTTECPKSVRQHTNQLRPDWGTSEKRF